MEGVQTRQKPDNYLIWAILSTLLCCLPLGVVSIINASKVDSEWNAGRYDEAVAAAANAKKWAMFSAGAGVIAYAIMFILTIIAALVG